MERLIYIIRVSFSGKNSDKGTVEKIPIDPSYGRNANGFAVATTKSTAREWRGAYLARVRVHQQLL